MYNASSSPKTLAIMRNIAFIGVPFVLAYTTAIIVSIMIYRKKKKGDAARGLTWLVGAMTIHDAQRLFVVQNARPGDEFASARQ